MDFFVIFEQCHSFELPEYYYRLKIVLAKIERMITRFSEQMA